MSDEKYVDFKDVLNEMLPLRLSYHDNILIEIVSYSDNTYFKYKVYEGNKVFEDAEMIPRFVPIIQETLDLFFLSLLKIYDA